MATACSNRRTYTLFFEWIYPEYTPTLQRACATYYNSPEVTTPLLKLYAELVYNKARPLVISPSQLFITPSRRTPSRSNPNPNPNPKQAQRLTFDSSSPNGILLFR